MSTDWIPTLWSDTFDEMLEEELEDDDRWTFQFNYKLKEDLSNEERRRGWKIYSHCTYGEFICGTCNKFWRSARVVVLFHYRLRSDRGTVIMRPFGQACGHCKEDFWLPGFSQEKVEEVLLRLFGKIKKNCYGIEDEDEDHDSVGSEKVLTKPHKSSLCEACSLGICCQDD